MPWFIVNPDGKKVEAFRSEGEARKALLDYEDSEVKFIPSSRLQGQRVQKGISQNVLATLAEVPIRNIRAWERKDVNINKASVEDVLRIAKVLGCRIEDLLE